MQIFTRRTKTSLGTVLIYLSRYLNQETAKGPFRSSSPVIQGDIYIRNQPIHRPADIISRYLIF